MNIKIYTIPDCKYCQMAKELIKTHQINYEEINMDRSEYVTKINEILTHDQRKGEKITKAPQILINDELIGGYTQLFNRIKYDSIDFMEDF